MRQLHLDKGMPNYVTHEGLEALKKERKDLEDERLEALKKERKDLEDERVASSGNYIMSNFTGIIPAFRLSSVASTNSCN